MTSDRNRAVRSALLGLSVNLLLAVGKGVAGVLGNAYVLVADAVESSTDVFSSLIVWRGVSVAGRPPDDEHPYGHGKADAIAAAIVALFLLGAAIGIILVAIREIRSPHSLPATFTLYVSVGVVVIKELLYRRVVSVGDAVGSAALYADAWHHRADAITSAAAVLGIGLALLGGPGWETADDWAAIVAAGVVAVNGGRTLVRAVRELMDTAPAPEVRAAIAAAAMQVSGVMAIEKLRVRGTTGSCSVDLHVQTDPALPLREAHILSGRVKSAIRAAVPAVASVLIHIEPYEVED
ncbi:MAG TPA: cation diffusion facilitator family transporter [Gemmatimonadaceae bacterium]